MSVALGRYELLRPLARGGMAEVFLARRRAAGVEKWLVVKRMRPERAGDARFLDLFVREARLSMSLAHQNIVPVFDFGRIDDQVFLAMERVEGNDLATCLTSGGPLPPLVAAFVAAECCQALEYAHLRRGPDGACLGIVHRDVTPRNVLLSWSGEVKLTDFGIAALAGEDSSKIVGTPAYMAPEQARGDAVDVRADVYAVGLVLREALTGERPRRGDDRDAVLALARTGELPEWPREPEKLAAIAERATRLEPTERYADAREMLAALDAYIVGERAAKTADAPARQLADWLAAHVQAERGGSDAAVAPLDGSQLVSFLDDGALDVIGTGTARSMAATIGADVTEAREAPPPEAPVASPAPARAVWRKRMAVVVGIGVGAFAIGAIGDVALGIGDRTVHGPKQAAEPAAPPVPPVARIVSAHARIVSAPAPKPAPATPPAPAPVPVLASAPIAHAAPVRAPRLATRDKIAAPAPAPAIPPPLHEVMINVAHGWAYFTIDAAADQYQTLATVRLPAGPHVIHFARADVHRDVSIAVPDDDQLRLVVDLSR